MFERLRRPAPWQQVDRPPTASVAVEYKGEKLAAGGTILQAVLRDSRPSGDGGMGAGDLCYDEHGRLVVDSGDDKHSLESVLVATHTITCTLSDPVNEQDHPEVDRPEVLVSDEMDCLLDALDRVHRNTMDVHRSLMDRSSGPDGGGDGQDCLPRDDIAALALLGALIEIGRYFRSRYDRSRLEQIPVVEDVSCQHLATKILRQLSDPVAVAAQTVPPWIRAVARACPYLPREVRHACQCQGEYGVPRALQHLQKRLLSQACPDSRRKESDAPLALTARQKVRVNRHRLHECALRVLSPPIANRDTILEIEFMGEVGTGSGPTLEFYSLVADHIRSDPPLLRPCTDGRLFFQAYDPSFASWPSGRELLSRGTLLGLTMAKCLIDGRLLDLDLHPMLFQAIWGYALPQSALRELDPQLHESLCKLRDLDDATLAGLGLTFTHPSPDPLGGNVALDADPDRAVDASCLEEYIGLVVAFTLSSGIEPFLRAVREAFEALTPLSGLEIWTADEAPGLFAGTSLNQDHLWTTEALSTAFHAAHGYTTSSPQFRHLVKLASELGQEERRAFLKFLTGSATLPEGGFEGLRPPLTVVRKERPSPPLTPDDFLPSVMTCAHYLKLPEYSSFEALEKQVKLAMSDGQSGFLLS